MHHVSFYVDCVKEKSGIGITCNYQQNSCNYCVTASFHTKTIFIMFQGVLLRFLFMCNYWMNGVQLSGDGL